MAGDDLNVMPFHNVDNRKFNILNGLYLTNIDFDFDLYDILYIKKINAQLSAVK